MSKKIAFGLLDRLEEFSIMIGGKYDRCIKVWEPEAGDFRAVALSGPMRGVVIHVGRDEDVWTEPKAVRSER